LSTTQAKYLPTGPIRKQLQQTWQTLGLTEADVIAIESPIIAQINLYQQNLEQYEREFDNFVQQQYPLGEAKCNELTQLKLTLNLSDNDVTAIESPIKAAIEKHLHKLQQYEEAFLEAFQHEFPLTEENSQDLERFQQVLEMSKEDAAKIEERVININNVPPDVPPDIPPDVLIRPNSRFSPIPLNQMITKLQLLFSSINSKLILGIIGMGIASIALVILFKPSECSKETGDFISEGEDILNYSKPSAKIKGAEYFAQCDYKSALSRFKDAWQSDKLDPETLIYLNNALLETKQAEYYTVAVAVSIPRDQNSPVDDSRAKEMLRGVAQLQTEINLGLFGVNDQFVKDFPGQGVLNGKAINGKGLKVVITNDENNESKAKQRAEALSKRPEILGVVGHYPSEMTVATVDIYDRENLVLISPGSTTNELTTYPRKNFLRTVFSVEQQSPKIAKFLQEKFIKKVVSFYSQGSPFSDSFHESFKNIFKQSPFYGTVVKVSEFDLGKPDFNEKKAIQELRRKEGIVGTTIGLVLFPDAVGNAQNNAIKLIKLNDGQNWVIGSWGLRSPNTLKQIDNLQPFQKFVIAVPWDSLTSPNQDFLKDVKNLWGTASVNAITALSYDATLALTKALEKENSPTRINILDQLKAPTFSVDGGATGTIEFNPDNGDRKNPSVEFVHIVECQTDNLDFAFVPIKYPTAKDAGLRCLN
jgi:branched-chain amino acid transport system substrate-binding protein